MNKEWLKKTPWNRHCQPGAKDLHQNENLKILTHFPSFITFRISITKMECCVSERYLISNICRFIMMLLKYCQRDFKPQNSPNSLKNEGNCPMSIRPMWQSNWHSGENFAQAEHFRWKILIVCWLLFFQFWETVAQEHGVEANGKFVGEIKCLEEFLSQHSSLFSLMIFAGNDGDDKLDKISVYFNEASNYNYVPRSVMVDLVRKFVKSITR